MAAIPIRPVMDPKTREKQKLWFNWPLVLGLILNFLVLGLLGWVVGRPR